ncbi:MAG: hypothetical protein C5B51_22060 [Terriglobia bacterium]|nr:MAG: hypothetical protein C5B51_22060 [Terriglobia bacterium]
MQDWKAIAKAQGLPLAAAELDRAATALRTLEDVFRPLTAHLPHSLDPATVFDPDPEHET